MARLNVPLESIFTHEGAKAKRINPELALRRSVMNCLLWEDEFYEDGQYIAERIYELVGKVPARFASELAIEARTHGNLRHAPLWIARAMAKHSQGHIVGDTIAGVIQRADELAEFLAIYWKNGKQPLSAQVKLGLAKAFIKFSAYDLAKYNRDGAVKLRDVLFLCHAKPKDSEQATVWKKLIEGTLEPPDTWEVALSASKGVGKKKQWERLLREDKLGALALLRNLRNFQETGVDEGLVRGALLSAKTDRVLPFRFIAAARHAPHLEPELEQLMFKRVEGHEKLHGRTALLVDVSGSMDGQLSRRSEMLRVDAASGLAVLLREICESIWIFTFSEFTVAIPARRGFALRDAIQQSQNHSSTHLGRAVERVNESQLFDRIIVITDEQAHDSIPAPTPTPGGHAYLINVASAKNGVGYGAWTHIDGFSESVVDYIIASETFGGQIEL